MATFSLKDIQNESENRYGNLVVDDAGVHYCSMLRLGEKDRKRMKELAGKIDELRADESAESLDKLETYMHEMLTTVASDAEKHKALMKQLDSADVYTLFELWADTTQPGEASA